MWHSRSEWHEGWSNGLSSCALPSVWIFVLYMHGALHVFVCREFVCAVGIEKSSPLESPGTTGDSSSFVASVLPGGSAKKVISNVPVPWYQMQN